MKKKRRGEAEPAKNRVFEGKNHQKNLLRLWGLGVVPGSEADYGG